METASIERERTFSWKDPAEIARPAPTMSGVEFLRSLDGLRTAPVAECLAFALTEVDQGRVVFEMDAAEFHYNPIGTVHGGVLATLCDSAMGAAVHSTLEAGEAYTTLEMKIQFVRPVRVASGRIRCEGAVVTRGNRVATAEARLTDASGTLCATSTATCLVFGITPPSKK